MEGVHTFDYKKSISYLLTKPDINVFDKLIEDIEAYFHRQVSTIAEMKERDSKKAKGDVWELFCRDWLLASQKYLNVWLWKDYCAQFNTGGPKQDNGIDLVAQTATGWVAVQCKYRSGKTKLVGWKGLSTFIGLCERTGPWERYLVMTNASGITRKVPRTAKDQSMCVGLFRATDRDTWLRMAGQYQEHRLSDPSPGLTLKVIGQPMDTGIKPKTLEELRAARLAKFSTQQ